MQEPSQITLRARFQTSLKICMRYYLYFTFTCNTATMAWEYNPLQPPVQQKFTLKYFRRAAWPKCAQVINHFVQTSKVGQWRGPAYHWTRKTRSARWQHVMQTWRLALRGVTAQIPSVFESDPMSGIVINQIYFLFLCSFIAVCNKTQRLCIHAYCSEECPHTSLLNWPLQCL